VRLWLISAYCTLQQTNCDIVELEYRPRDTLQAAGVPKIYVDSPEVGHGADHTEIAVMYEWLDRWNDPTTGGPPPGGTNLPFLYTRLLRQRTTGLWFHMRFCLHCGLLHMWR
jgi:hypothetical protein